MIRTSLGRGRYIPGDDPITGEWDMIYGTLRAWDGSQPNGIVFCHGAGDTALTVAADPVQHEHCTLLARRSTVIAADLGLQTWGNDTGITRIGQAVAHLRATYGVVGPVGLVGGSMGNANAMAYALAHPDEVAFIAGIIPLIDIADVMGRGAAAEVNAAYGGAYNDVTDGPTHSPIHFATALPADLPIRLWSSPTDALTPYATAVAFQAARPQTVLSVLPDTGHSDASFAAATPEVVGWARDRFYGMPTA